jgi:hypothetical protein
MPGRPHNHRQEGESARIWLQERRVDATLPPSPEGRLTGVMSGAGRATHYSKRRNFRRLKPSDIRFRPSEISYVRRH